MFDPRVEHAGSDNESMNLYGISILIGTASRLVERTIARGGTPEEIERVSKYYYAVLDVAKPHLDWMTAYLEFGIEELIKKYGVQKGEKDEQNVL